LTKKRLILLLGFVVLAVLALVGGLFVYINSPAFDVQARRYILQQIEQQTGAEVTLKSFDWSFRRQTFLLEELTLRGLEPQSGPPLAFFPRIDVGLNFRSLYQRKIHLFELTLTAPQFYIIVDESGKTNFPTPPPRDPRGSFNFEITIDNFRIIDSTANLNERRINVDFALKNLASELSYKSTTGILTSHLKYEGEYVRPDKPVIPYSFDADMNYTRGTLLPHRIDVTTGVSRLRLQGRIDDLLKKTIAGRLEYTGNVNLPFLNYFFTREKFAGKADVAGFLEFSNGYFFTKGSAASESVNFEDWIARDFRSEYSYYYPEKRASFRNLRTNIAGGVAAGSVAVENIPGPSRVVVDIDYNGVDAATFARVYPWDPKYRIFSRVSGTLNGWFEGKLDRYVFSGDAALKAYTPSAIAGVVPLPLDGSTGYEVQPGQARIANGDVRFGSTHVRADGLIHETASNLKVVMDSTDLRDGYFIYEDANGSGTFDGTATGPIKSPLFDGDFTLRNHTYAKKWLFEDAAGHVRLNSLTGVADLQDVRLNQGRSQILVSGTTELDGAPADLRIQAVRVFGEDLLPFVNRKIDGAITGNVRLTSFNPIKVEGDLRADNLFLDGRTVGNTRGHVRYFEPLVELDSLTITRNGSTLTGEVAFNRLTEAVKFSARVSSVDFNSIRWLGLPESINGVIRQADLQGDGTLKQPNVRGSGIIQNLAFKSEVFPQVRVTLTSRGSTVAATIDAAANLKLETEINTLGDGYPFTANATFTNYSLEKIAGFAQGSLTASGAASLAGLLNDSKTIRGQGHIDTAQAVIQNHVFRSTNRFTFDFNPDRLAVSNINLTGDGTEASVAGTIGLTETAPLNLNVQGKIDLSLLAAATTGYVVNGTVNIDDGRIRGTAQNPDLGGVAHLANVSVSRPGFFTSLTNLNGDFSFEENRVFLNEMQGQVGGGTIRLQGIAQLRQTQIQSMNIRIEADDVRLRYPEGLRTVVDGGLVLRGSWDSPLLEGNLEIQSMSYRSSFEEFLSMFGTPGFAEGPSQFDQLRLSLHVEGGRNIIIQNQLADVEARVNLDIKGTFGHPALTGHVEASGGTLSFQGKRYTITRGNVDFVDPIRIEPVIDLQAESDIRDYRVILSVTGRGDRLRLDMRSDPPLSQIDVVNLIAGGKTREELFADTGKTVTEEQLFKGSAASILTDLIQERIGGSPFERLGLTRVRIGPDPSLVSTQNQAIVRITVEQQVTKDLSITYSRALSSETQDIVEIEYFLSKNTSIIASRNEVDAKALDIKFLKRIKP